MTAEEFQRLQERQPLGQSPRVVLEVCTAGEPWFDCLTRVVRHFSEGIPVVLLADPVTTSISVYRLDDPPRVFKRDTLLAIPDVLPGFAAPVARFFEE